MYRFDNEFYNLVFPFRRVFCFDIDDLEKLKTEGYWASVNCTCYTFYLKLQVFEPTDNRETYLSSSALLAIDTEDTFHSCPSLNVTHRLRVINNKTKDDHVTDWDLCGLSSERTRDELFKIIDWSTLLNCGFEENGSISFEWELNIETKYFESFKSCYYSPVTLRVHRIWSLPTFRIGLKVQTEKFEKDVLFENINEKEYSLSNELQIIAMEDQFWKEVHFKTGTPEKCGRVLLEAFISHPNMKSYAMLDLYNERSSFYISKSGSMGNIDEKSNLHFKICVHQLESPVDKFALKTMDDSHKFRMSRRIQFRHIQFTFFKSVLMNYSKFVHDFFTKQSSSQKKSSTESTDVFFKELKACKKCYKISNIVEIVFFHFAMLIHNCEEAGQHLLTDELKIEDLLLLIEILDSPEGFRRCDAMMTELEFKDDLSILKLVAQYPLPQMKTIYKKKYQDAFEWKQLMQNEDFKSLPPEFVQDLAKNHDNEIECDITLRYDSSDSNFSKVDQVVFSDSKTGEEHTVNKMVLANASDYFWMRFVGPHSKRDDKYVIFDDGIPKNFVIFLNQVYHPTNPITHHNFDALLEMAHRFDAYTLLHKLEKFLVFNENYSLTDKLKYANDYDLAFVLEYCLNSVKCFDDLEKLKKEEKFIQLPAEFKQFVQENIRWRIRTFV